MSKNFNNQRWVYIGIIVLVILLLGWAYVKVPVKEAIEPPRKADVAVILNDNTISPDQKINMIRQINIQDPAYRNIIEGGMNNQKKVDKLNELFL